MFQFADLRDEISRYLEPEQVEIVAQAYVVAEQAHAGQMRRSGQPYITHPVEVARILAEVGMDHESIMVALLHDVLEDTDVDKDFLDKNFGSSVAELVDGVSKLTQIKFVSRQEAQAENFRKMLLAMVRDIRVIIVKLADRLHNMRTLGALPREKKRRIARETLDIYAPIANRLGMRNFRVEYEDLGFCALYPMRARVLKESIRKARGNRKEILKMIETALANSLEGAGFNSGSVKGREKHLYSIYRKMRDKRLSFSEIMDVYAFRIIAPSIDDCYRILGVMHQLYKPMLGRFKDYIAIPKANGYQSLHTTLFGPYGVPIEIQIRTLAMDRMGENGIAAHWLYKSPEASVNQAQSRARAWLKSLLELQNNTTSSIEFIENVKVDLFPSEVFVFSPKGDIFELPKGATTVDFAYAVHTDVGNTCVAARIDRHLSPLSSPLVNGQTVEIISAPGANPNPAWLSFVVTSKARSNIRHFLKNQRRSESIALGRRLLEAALAPYEAHIDNIPASIFDLLLTSLKIENIDDLFVDIGLGNRTGVLVARHLMDLTKKANTDITDGKDAIKAGLSSTSDETEPSQPLKIKGTEGLLINFAKCCHPIPGDPIIGFLSIGQGLTVHLESCKNIQSFRHEPNKCVPLCWEENMTGEFLVELTVEVAHQRGILASLTAAIDECDGNIESICSEEKDGLFSSIIIVLGVADRIHLARIMKKMRVLKSVKKIFRSRK